MARLLRRLILADHDARLEYWDTHSRSVELEIVSRTSHEHFESYIRDNYRVYEDTVVENLTTAPCTAFTIFMQSLADATRRWYHHGSVTEAQQYYDQRRAAERSHRYTSNPFQNLEEDLLAELSAPVKKHHHFCKECKTTRKCSCFTGLLYMPCRNCEQVIRARKLMEAHVAAQQSINAVGSPQWGQVVQTTPAPTSGTTSYRYNVTVNTQNLGTWNIGFDPANGVENS